MNEEKIFFEITNFIQTSDGLTCERLKEGLTILQGVDEKSICLQTQLIERVIPRSDFFGKEFLQVNFLDESKLLLTQNLVGFKPVILVSLDMAQLPKVVSTSDLERVVEAIEESMNSEEASMEELEVLKRIFIAVLEGGEAVGFDLSEERGWLYRLLPVKAKWA